MSIFNWFNKILGIDDSKIKTDLPSEFRLPTEYSNTDVSTRDFGHNDIDDPFTEDMFNDFNNINIVMSGLGEMLRVLHFPHDGGTSEDTNFIENRNLNQLSNKEEYYNGIPKKNFQARNYFLSSGTSLDEPAARETTSPRLNLEKVNSKQAKSKSYSRSFGYWNGKAIEKETTTRQLPDGNTERITVMKDGNQKCIVTVTENSKTGVQNYNKELINLDENQLVEFENRFSKLRW